MAKRLFILITLLLLVAAFTVAQAQGTTLASGDGTSNTVIFAQSQPPVNGIIMRDGGVCDPIRHMGC